MKTTLNNWKSIFAKAILILPTVSVLSSCGDTEKKLIVDAAGCRIPAKYKIQISQRDTVYQPYRILIEDEKITWNGAPVTTEVLKKYAQELSAKPAETGGTTFRVFGVPCSKRTEVREVLAQSKLCEKNRCWEDDKSKKPPIAFPHDTGTVE